MENCGTDSTPLGSAFLEPFCSLILVLLIMATDFAHPVDTMEVLR